MSRETFDHAKGYRVAASCVMPRRDSLCSVCGGTCTGMTAVQVRNASDAGPFALFCRTCVERMARVVAQPPEAPAAKPSDVMVL